jgi:hypothetical protein
VHREGAVGTVADACVDLAVDVKPPVLGVELAGDAAGELRDAEQVLVDPA